MEAKEIRTFLQDRDKTQKLVAFSINKILEKHRAEWANYSKADEMLEILKTALNTFYPQAIDFVYDYAQSEIEKLFINSFIICFMLGDPLGLKFEPAKKYGLKEIQETREYLKIMLEIDKQHFDETGETGGWFQYIDYLLSDDFYDFKMEYAYMSYKSIKENYIEYNVLPPWFEYYDLRKGTGSLIRYPNIRGEKEEYYINIWQNHNSSKSNTKTTVKVLTHDTRPFLNSHELSIIEEFIKKYEEGKVLEYFRLYENELSKSNDEIDQAIKILKESDETISIESNYNWKSAVMQAARKYEKKKLSEALHVAYNKYKYRLQVGIAQESLTHESNIQWIKEWCDEVKKKITKARELVNEPANLNF